MAAAEPKKWDTILTPLGACVMVGQPPEHLGTGILLVLTMQDKNDKRNAEVIISQDNIVELIAALESRLDKK